MISLIKFELFKIFKTKTYYYIFLVIISLSFIIVFLNYKSNEYIKEYSYIENRSDNLKVKELVKENNIIYNYITDNKIENYDKVKSSFNKSITFLMFTGFIFLFISSKILLNEFENGTIKNILTRHFSRRKLIISKFIMLLLITLLYISLIYISTIIFNAFIYRINPFKIKTFIYNSNIKEVLFLSKYTTNYFICSIPILFLTLITFNLSTITMNSYLSFIIGISLITFGPLISTMLLSIKFKIIKYTFLPYLDYNVLLNKIDMLTINEAFNITLNITKGNLILIIYLIITSVLAIWIFNKIDIK